MAVHDLQIFSSGSCYSIFSLMCNVLSLFVLLSFLFWPLCCLSFFDLRILITPLVSSNSSLLLCTLCCYDMHCTKFTVCICSSPLCLLNHITIGFHERCRLIQLLCKHRGKPFGGNFEKNPNLDSGKIKSYGHPISNEINWTIRTLIVKHRTMYF
jgi:hypothetical protein